MANILSTLEIKHGDPLAALEYIALATHVVTLPDLTDTIAHVRESLGPQAYESLAREGGAMMPTEMAA